MAYSTIALEPHGQVAVLRLNRPDKLNAMSCELLTETTAALKNLITKKDARVLVVTGAGRSFCAGFDLTDPLLELVDPRDANAPLRDYCLPLFNIIRELSIPTIAAVNGPAVGAGMALALSCDIVIAVRSAYFSCAFVNVGLGPDCGASWLMNERIGQARTAGLLLLGDRLPAPQAAEWGLIWKCVEDGALGVEVDVLAERLALGPPLAYGTIRRLVQKVGRNSLEEQVLLEMEYQAVTAASSDYVEARRAFAQKRQPVFKGC